MTPTGLACSKKEWMNFTASSSPRRVSAPTVPPGTIRPSYSSAETSVNVFSTVKVSPGLTSLFMVWASPVSMPTTSTVAPSSSTAFFGSVNSTCSVPTGARRMAIFLPCNSLATGVILSISLRFRCTRRRRRLNRLCYCLLRTGQYLGTIRSKHEGLLGFGSLQRGIPGEGLAFSYLLPRCGVRDDLTRGVAGHPSLVVVSPAFGVARFGVEAAAVVEGLGQGAAGAGSLFPHAAQDLFAGTLSAECLGVRVLEVDHLRQVGEETSALGAGDEHGLSSEGAALRNRMPVAHEPLAGGGQQHGGEHAPLQARRREVGRRLELVRLGREGGRDLGHNEDGVLAETPVGLYRSFVEDIAQGRYVGREIQGRPVRQVGPHAGAAGQLRKERVGAFVPGMLDDLHPWRLLLAHPGRFDVVGEDIGLALREQDACYPHGNPAVHPVVRAARVPGEVRRMAQE